MDLKFQTLTTLPWTTNVLPTCMMSLHTEDNNLGLQAVSLLAKRRGLHHGLNITPLFMTQTGVSVMPHNIITICF